MNDQSFFATGRITCAGMVGEWTHVLAINWRVTSYAGLNSHTCSINVRRYTFMVSYSHGHRFIMRNMQPPGPNPSLIMQFLNQGLVPSWLAGLAYAASGASVGLISRTPLGEFLVHILRFVFGYLKYVNVCIPTVYAVHHLFREYYIRKLMLY